MSHLIREASLSVPYEGLRTNWLSSRHRIWLVDGLLIGTIGFLVFAAYVGGARGEFEQWPRYAVACLLATTGVATVPIWRGGYDKELAIVSGVPRAFKAWAAVFSLLASLGFLLGELTGFSRVWFFGWLVFGSAYLIASRTHHLGRGTFGDELVSVRRFFGVDVSAMTADEAVEELDRRYRAGDIVKVGFANANTFRLSNESPAFRRCLERFFILNDGIGMDIACYLRFGRRFPENLNGTDFMPRYLERTSQRYRIYLLGSRPAVVAEAAEVFGSRFPRHRVVGSRHGFFGDADVPAICREIRARQADLLVVALGSPKQEIWITDNAAATGAKMFFGVGALFDFMSGHAVRAPGWVRRWRFEWAYRLVREPRRLWRRYIVGNAAFLRDALLETRH